METNTPSKAANPLREHAFGCIRASGYLSAAAAILFVASLPFTPSSPGYWVTAAAIGAASFPLLWRHWCRPNHLLFFVLIMLLVASGSSAERVFFPELRGSISWWRLMQFLCLYIFAELSLVFVFRRRLRESISRHSPVA